MALAVDSGRRAPKGPEVGVEVRGSQGGLGRLELALPDLDLVLFVSARFRGQRDQPFAQIPWPGRAGPLGAGVQDPSSPDPRLRGGPLSVWETGLQRSRGRASRRVWPLGI